MVGKKMGAEQKLMEKAGAILQKKGRIAVELARQTILREKPEYAPLGDALRYFIKGWNDFLHPALVSLACEAVGGKAEKTDKVGAALVLMAGGADIHDDVIDESRVKGSEQTVFGKFGNDLAILAGDALLFKGVYLLHEACEELEMGKKKSILEIVKRAFFEISGAEASEAGMRGKINVPKQVYLEVIRRKVAAGEASMRIGAILGDGTLEEVKLLAEYGRDYGVLLSVRDEFVDIYEQDELENRAIKEVLPLPLLVTLGDESKKTKLVELLQGKITEEKIETIVDIVTNSKETTLLVLEMRQLVNKTICKISSLAFCKEVLELLARAAVEDL